MESGKSSSTQSATTFHTVSIPVTGNAHLAFIHNTRSKKCYLRLNTQTNVLKVDAWKTAKKIRACPHIKCNDGQRPNKSGYQWKQNKDSGFEADVIDRLHTSQLKMEPAYFLVLLLVRRKIQAMSYCRAGMLRLVSVVDQYSSENNPKENIVPPDIMVNCLRQLVRELANRRCPAAAL